MKHCMFTRLAWTTFQPGFVQAAENVFGLRDKSAYSQTFETHFSQIVANLPEVSLNGKDTVLRVLAAMFVASMRSLEGDQTLAQQIEFYKQAIGVYDSIPHDFRQLPLDLFDPV